MITVVLALVVAGLILWLITFLPLQAPFPLIIRIVVIVCVVAYLLRAFGVLNHDIPVPQIR